jgi:hypothetical protein
MTSQTAHFTIKNNFQKRSGHYADILTDDILRDVCRRVTGSEEYTVDFIDEVNVGRLATLEYGSHVVYISFSEDTINGRNSSFQSLPSALVRYYQDPRPDKQMYFYFLPSTGNPNTAYFNFMYRLMVTAGVGLLNADQHLPDSIHPFISIEDMIAARDNNRSRNASNNSTYVTRDMRHIVQIYGKTYGASKKETTLLCIALSHIATSRIELFEINEQNLTQLPQPDLEVIRSLGKVDVIETDLTMERREFEQDNSLRSPRYTYNLLAKLGPKKCAFCDCAIPDLIQGAHIWPVADIKREARLSMDDKLAAATDGENGIWLCQNHHTLFDNGLLQINLSGMITYREGLDGTTQAFIRKATPVNRLDAAIMTDELLKYLRLRYRLTETANAA